MAMAKADPTKPTFADEYLSPMDQYATSGPRRKSRILPLPEDASFLHKTLSEGPTPSEDARRSSTVSGASPSASAASEVSGYNRGVRRNSQESFAEKMHTTLVLDWDDTLFPTTWVREDCRLNWRLSLDRQPQLPDRQISGIKAMLEKHLVRVAEFFGEAECLANIFIVTLARRPWVENSIEKFMPGLQGIIEKHSLKVIYAQESADPKEVNEYMDGSKTAEEGQRFWTSVKGNAIAKELDAFHRRFDASWKNVISLGDSDFERYGTLIAGQDYMKREMEGGSVVQTGHTAEGVSKDGHLKRLRVKTVKMLDKPTVLELTAELTLLRRWLPHVVRRDAGFDVEIDGTDDDSKLQDLHKQVTDEEDTSLTWKNLAGMSPVLS